MKHKMNDPALVECAELVCRHAEKLDVMREKLMSSREE